MNRLEQAFMRGFIKAAAGVDPQVVAMLVEKLKHYEGARPSVYQNPSEDFKTIGYGHYLSPGSEGLFNRLFGTNVNYNAMLQGKQNLNQSQMDTLLRNDITNNFSRAQSQLPKMQAYPKDVQSAIVNGYFRGDLAGSPRTRKDINQGNWQGAAKEYLRNKEYKNAAKLGRRGVRPRMEEVSQTFDNYGKQLMARRSRQPQAVGAPQGKASVPTNVATTN